MLQGEGIAVREMIRDVKERAAGDRGEGATMVRVYDSRGIEVFAPPSPVPDRANLPDPVRQVLDGTPRIETDNGWVYRAVAKEDSCLQCHAEKESIRGVLAIQLDPKACVSDRDAALERLVTEGFLHVMTAEKASLLDDYFEQLSHGVVSAVAVYDADPDEPELKWGSDQLRLDPDELREALVPRAGASRRRHETGTLSLIPLPMESRCVKCHEGSDPVRGAIALELSPPTASCDVAGFEMVIDRSLRTIMLSNLGRRIADFLDAAASTRAIRKLELYDRDGRLFWTTEHPKPPDHVARALDTRKSAEDTSGMAEDQQVLVVWPLLNREECTQCHGYGTGLRGVVTVQMSTAVAQEALEQIMRDGAVSMVTSLVGVLIVLLLVLQFFVVRPVREIGDVADAVGEGNLDRSVRRADENGDEVARLGSRINQMVEGLRAKTQLEKFVSKGTAAAAQGAGVGGVAREGETRDVTVLFSDIRGFTSFAENRAPQRVVDMLNRVLQAQAEVIEELGGDIDKFVGDEVMALFHGVDAAPRAVRCALRLTAVVRDSLRGAENLAVGVGVSCGDVIYGAIGSERRLDFTVIGDVVNTGARLCSAAAANEVLVTESVQRACESASDIAFEPGDALELKGKRERLAVFRAGSKR
jgi:adenylate cyclase